MSEISAPLLNWYTIHKRPLPWRETRDPYKIWVSEIILQQTRIAQGMDYYLRFIDRFPDVLSLARASEDEVLKYWQGLGYYSRARNLLAAARTIQETYNGSFPTSYQEVRALKGVGDYTAAAICSIAYALPVAAVDGNVYRVLARIFNIDLPIDSAAGKRYFSKLAAAQLDERHPGEYNQAIMDFGALQCTPGTPDCSVCPLEDKCLALARGRIAELPVKKGRTAVRDRYFYYFHILCEGRTWMHRREGKDIWLGLYEFPLIETDGPIAPDDLQNHPGYRSLFGGAGKPEILSVFPEIRHILSHQVLHIRFLTVAIPHPGMGLNNYTSLALQDIPHLATPRPIEAFLKAARQENK